MVITLPPEIWREVAGYVPSDRLQELYAVNHTFFAVAMEAKYQRVRFDHHEVTSRYLDCLASPVASQHVRTLHLTLHRFLCAMRKHTPFGYKKGVLAKIFGQPRSYVTKTAQQVERMVAVMNMLPEVTSMELYSHLGPRWFRDVTPFIPIIKAGWTTFGNNLHSLSLAISMESYHVVIPPAIVFPRLEVLCVTLSKAFSTTDTGPVLREVFTPFVNNHHTTLRSLRLTCRPNDECDLSPFLRNLRHLPQLTTLSLSDYFHSIRQWDGVERVLELHAQQLLELRLLMYRSIVGLEYRPDPTPEEWYEQRFLQVQLSKLEVLELGKHVFWDVRRTAKYLQQFTHSLTSLSLSPHPFSYGDGLSRSDVEILVNIFAGQNILKTLSMKVNILNPQLLALLSSRLPGLETLGLVYQLLSSELSFENTTSVLQLRKALSRFSYAGWKLRSFITYHNDYVGYDVKHIRACEQVLREALPGVETLRLG